MPEDHEAQRLRRVDAQMTPTPDEELLSALERYVSAVGKPKPLAIQGLRAVKKIVGLGDDPAAERRAAFQQGEAEGFSKE
jgi:hypothetical protein